MQTIEQPVFIRGFSREKCTGCGQCIAGCRYLDITPKQARGLMEKIIVAGPGWYPELAACIRCGKCDHRCPEDANPGNLMRECLEFKRRETGRVPAAVEYAVNGLGPEGWRVNFFKDVYRGLGKKDKRILRQWAEPKTGKDLLWVGCTDRMMPRILENSRALRHLAKFGGPDDCCGIFAVQGGFLEEGFRVADRLLNRFAECRFDRLVVACGHCQKVLTRILPDMLGIELPFPLISIYDYFMELIQKDAVKIENFVDRAVVVSDPCFGYENGQDYLKTIRDLSNIIGMTVSEMPHNREKALCCGYGGLFTNGKISDVAGKMRIKRKDLAQCGQKDIVSYCPGCHLMNHYFQPGYKSHYLLEEVLSALGERIETPFSVFYRRLIRPHIAWNLMGTLFPDRQIHNRQTEETQ